MGWESQKGRWGMGYTRGGHRLMGFVCCRNAPSWKGWAHLMLLEPPKIMCGLHWTAWKGKTQVREIYPQRMNQQASTVQSQTGFAEIVWRCRFRLAICFLCKFSGALRSSCQNSEKILRKQKERERSSGRQGSAGEGMGGRRSASPLLSSLGQQLLLPPQEKGE